MEIHSLVISCVVLVAVSSFISSAHASAKADEQVKLVIVNNATSSQGGKLFESMLGNSGALNILRQAIKFVQSQFSYGAEHVPKKIVTKITFEIQTVLKAGPNVVAYTRSYPNVNNWEIHFGAHYFRGDHVVKDFKGVLYHEMVHVWQWKPEGLPAGLEEGIADFVRLKAGLAPSHWVQPGEGESWDQGYDVTAYFLNYCNDIHQGFVSDLNTRLLYGWNKSIFVDLLGKSVEELWSDYKKHYAM